MWDFSISKTLGIMMKTMPFILFRMLVFFGITIAYIFASPHWGQGLASEAVDAMIDELREQYDVKILSATLKRNNERSTRLLTRLGFSIASEAMSGEHEIEADETLMMRDVVQI